MSVLQQSRRHFFQNFTKNNFNSQGSDSTKQRIPDLPIENFSPGLPFTFGKWLRSQIPFFFFGKNPNPGIPGTPPIPPPKKKNCLRTLGVIVAGGCRK